MSIRGPGRPKGSRSLKNMLKAAAVCEKLGVNPIEKLIAIAEHKNTDSLHAIEIWKFIQTYCQPAYKPIEVADEDEPTDDVEESGYDTDALESAAEDAH